MYIKKTSYFTVITFFLILQTTACNQQSKPSSSEPSQPLIPSTTKVTPNVSITPYDELILGRWYGEQTSTKQDVTTAFKTTTEYFPNKTSNTEGSISISKINQEHNITINYNVVMTGTWLITNQSLTETVVDVKSSIDSVGMDGITYSSERIPEDVINSVPKPEDFVPKGTSNLSKIISLTSSELKVEERDNDGTVSSTIYHKH